MSESSNMLASEINALPDHVRRYVHDLETRCDPAGDTVTIFALRENCSGLELLLQRARATIRELEAALDMVITTLGRDSVEYDDVSNIIETCISAKAKSRAPVDGERG